MWSLWIIYCYDHLKSQVRALNDHNSLFMEGDVTVPVHSYKGTKLQLAKALGVTARL